MDRFQLVNEVCETAFHDTYTEVLSFREVHRTCWTCTTKQVSLWFSVLSSGVLMCLPVESSWAVLDAILGGTMASYPDGVWVITGTGHHRSGHAAEGVLFNSVKVRVCGLAALLLSRCRCRSIWTLVNICTMRG